MTKQSAKDAFKYVLAIALLTAVVWLNWGFTGKVASKIVVDGAPAPAGSEADTPTLHGKVVAVNPGEMITIQPLNAANENDGEPVEFILVDRNNVPIKWPKLIKWPEGIVTATHIDLPAGESTLQPGMKVALWEGPQGLGYVWHRHFTQGVPVHWNFFCLAAVLCLASLLITLVRWYVLVRALDLPFTLPNALRLGFVGFFFNTFLPGSVGGDIIKAAFLAREQSGRRTAAVSTVILDRAIALWGLVCFVAMTGSIFWLAGLIPNPVAQNIVVGAIVIVAVSLVMWGVLGVLPDHRAERFAGRLSRLPKVGAAAAEFWRAVWMYRRRQGSIAIALLLSWVGHVGFVLTFYFCARTLLEPDAIPSLWEHFLIVPIGLVIQAMPLFPGGAGIGELGFGGLYKLLGFAAASGVLASLVQRVIMWILGAFSYLVYLRMKPALQSAVAALPGKDATLNGSPAAPALAGASQPQAAQIL